MLPYSEDMTANDVFPEGIEMMRQAARLGPGYKSRRVAANPDERARLCQAMREAGLEPPAYLSQNAEWIDRRAKLFQAGDYPDKQLVVTQQALDALAATFDLPAPLLIEHARSPLELGYLTHVERIGDELFGSLALTKEANDLVERSGARSLSLGLSSDLSQIREVSLVRNPRVADARLFCEGPVFHAELETLDWRARFRALEAEIQRKACQEEAQELVRQGRIVPAQREIAEALLARSDVIEFGVGFRPISELVRTLLERAAPRGLFAECAPDAQARAEPSASPDEAAFYERHFPGVPLTEILRRKTTAPRA